VLLAVRAALEVEEPILEDVVNFQSIIRASGVNEVMEVYIVGV